MRLTTVFPLLLVTGCVGVTTTLKQPLDGLTPDKGVVVFSTGASEVSYMSVIGLKLVSVAPDGRARTHSTDIMMNRGDLPPIIGRFMMRAQ